MRKGNIVDIDNTSKDLEKVLNELERLTGIDIYHAVVGFSSGSVNSINNHAMVAANNASFEITAEDKERVLKSASNVALPAEKTLVQTLVREYKIDGFDGVKEPVGMAGSRLEVNVTLLIAATAAIQNLIRCTSNINLKIDKLIYNPLLAAEAVVLPFEKEVGVLLLDIGAGTTEISFFEKGHLAYATVLPIGVEYITHDISLVLRTSWEDAERIKIKYGIADPEQASEELMIDINNMKNKQNQTVSQKNIAEIIFARLLEIVEMVYAELKGFGILAKCPAGIVLSGGGAELSGFVEFLEKHLEMPVRLGKHENVNNLADEYNKPIYANVLGGLQYAAQNFDLKQFDAKLMPRLFDNVVYWIKDLFG